MIRDTYDPCDFPRGQRVRMTWHGLRHLHGYADDRGPFNPCRQPPQPTVDQMHGFVTGHSRDGRCIHVMRDHCFTAASYYYGFWEPVR